MPCTTLQSLSSVLFIIRANVALMSLDGCHLVVLCCIICHYLPFLSLSSYLREREREHGASVTACAWLRLRVIAWGINALNGPYSHGLHGMACHIILLKLLPKFQAPTIFSVSCDCPRHTQPFFLLWTYCF